MELETTSHIIQLLLALTGAFILFILAYLIPEKIALYFLALLIPFQLIDSRYGSINMVMTYALGMATLLKSLLYKKLFLKRTSLDIPIIILLIIYVISLIQSKYILNNLFYLINFGANIVIFYLAVNLLESEQDVKRLIYTLGVSCSFVIIYCILQGIMGEKRLVLLGIQEWTLFPAAKGATRLMGPFNAVGITAEYFVISILLQIYMFISEREKYKKLFWIILLIGSFATLIATGNRGGFISLILGLFLINFLFKEKGTIYLFILPIIFIGILIVTSYFVIRYTKYNLLYERLLSTRLEKGAIPDTRYIAWKNAIEGIKNKPIFGHGPRFKLFDSSMKKTSLFNKTHYFDIKLYPHNLYLFIFYTLGIVGLIAYIIFFLRFYSCLKIYNSTSDFLSGLINLGKIIFVVFLFDQMKVEFLRYNLTDYQQFIFLLFGMLTAITNIVKKSYGTKIS